MNDLNRVIVFIFCSLILVNIEGQSISPLESIGQLIRLGDSKKISAHLDKSVEITIENNQKLYSKAQAEQILNRFLKKTLQSNLILFIRAMLKKANLNMALVNYIRYQIKSIEHTFILCLLRSVI